MRKNLWRARPQAVRLATPPMSKAERLHRWADDLELQARLEWSGEATRRTSGPRTQPDASPLSVAFQDWALQAEGLRQDDELAFFDLSADQMERIVEAFEAGGRTSSAAVAAKRVRAFAEQAESTIMPHHGVFLPIGSAAPA
jgi:hypothetical protein